nr:Peptidase S24 S26A S26B domain containing protein [Haemonchus contortus]
MRVNRIFGKNKVLRYFAGAGVFYCVAHTIARHVGELVICSGPSMHPTIHDGDLVLAERLSVNTGNIHRGDIVGCLSPHEPEQLLCKRVVAKESDSVDSPLLPNREYHVGMCFYRDWFKYDLVFVYGRSPGLVGCQITGSGKRRKT